MLYNRIALHRAERNVSRKELADAVGVNFQTIGCVERGDYSPSLELGLKIARFFGVPVEMVFSFEPFEPLSAQLLRAKAQKAGETS
jgi:DNA-binding XRE family transcriptional regulator